VDWVIPLYPVHIFLHAPAKVLHAPAKVLQTSLLQKFYKKLIAIFIKILFRFYFRYYILASIRVSAQK